MKLQNCLLRISRGCCGLTIGIGALALLGWLSGLRALASINANYIPMAPNTAIAFIVLGIAAIILHCPCPHHVFRWLSAILAVCVVAMGVLTLLHAFKLTGFNINQALLKSPSELFMGRHPVGYLSPITMGNFLLSGTSLFLLALFPLRIYVRSIASWLATGVITVGCIVVFGYFFRTPILYGGNAVPMAFNTACAFVCTGFGLLMLAGPDCVPTSYFVGASVRARLMRGFFPILVLTTVLDEFVIDTFSASGSFSQAVVIGINAVVSGGIIGCIVFLISKMVGGSIERAEAGCAQVEESLRKSEERFRSIFEQAGVGVAIIDSATGQFLRVNKKYADIAGLSMNEMLATSFWNITHPDDRQANLDSMEKLRNGLVSEFSMEKRYIHKNGSVVWVSLTVSPLWLEGHDLKQHIAIVSDITERKKVASEMQMAYKVFENAVEGITVTDVDGTILYVNPAFTRITGYNNAEAVGRNPRVLRSDKHSNTFYKDMWTGLTEKGQWQGEIWNRRKSGEAYPEWLSISAIKDAAGKTTQYVAVFYDITDEKKSREQIHHLAYHDPLTGLPNRQLLSDRLDMEIKHAFRNNKKVSVLFVDLDDFKKINDSLGHLIGDALLREAAGRIKSHCREGDSVARVGGDEFVVLLSQIDDVQFSTEIADRIIKTLTKPFSIEGNHCYIGASIGIAIYPSDGSNPGELVKNADIAMFRAKEGGKNSYQLFTVAMNEEVNKRLELENNLRKAWLNKEFILFYQPKYCLKTKQIVGMEALLRWKASGGKLISPGEFLPLAEKLGLITQFDEWALSAACECLKRIRPKENDLVMAVNLSAKNFENGKLLDTIAETLRDRQVLPGRIELEVTESILIRNAGQAQKTVEDMRAFGLCVAIDDFGKGYSSLSYLKEFRVNTLKIDKSFVDHLGVDGKSKHIIKAIINMSHDMGIKVLAEGVEKQEQLEILCQLGCDEIQGYIYSTPLPEEQFARLLDVQFSGNSYSI